MGSNQRPSPAAKKFAEVSTQQTKPLPDPIQIDDKGNINVSGNVTAEQLRAAQGEARLKREGGLFQAGEQRPEDVETVSDVQAREKQTLANPRKARRRGRRSLVSGGLSGSLGSEGSLG